MPTLDGRTPNAHTDDGKAQHHTLRLFAHHGIASGYEHISGMERWYGSKHIGILSIKGMEDGESGECIETSQSRNVAWSMQNGFETILHNIPWWGGRMNIVATETKEVHHEEGNGKTQIMAIALLEVKI